LIVSGWRGEVFREYFGYREAGSAAVKRLAKTSPTLVCLRRQAKLARMGHAKLLSLLRDLVREV